LKQIISKEAGRIYFERLSLAATIGFVVFAGSGGFQFLKSKDSPKISPQAERILSNSMRSTAATIGQATLKAIVNNETVRIEDDTHHPGGKIIEIKISAPDLDITMDVRMEKQAKELKAQTTYGVSVHEEVPSQGYSQVGAMTESDGHWMGTFDSSSDLADGLHLSTEPSGNPDDTKLRDSAKHIAANTDKLSNLTLDILKATTTAA